MIEMESCTCATTFNLYSITYGRCCFNTKSCAAKAVQERMPRRLPGAAHGPGRESTVTVPLSTNILRQGVVI